MGRGWLAKFLFSGCETVKKAAFIILFVICLLNITGCNRKEEIVIGLNYEGSGMLAPYGKALLWGAQLAVEEINASGGVDGRQVRLVKADNRSIGAESAAAVLYLSSVKDADVIIGPATSTLAKAALSAGADVLIISPSATADELTANTAPLVVSDRSLTFRSQRVDDCAKVCLPFISHRERSASLPSATADELTANTAPLVVSDRSLTFRSQRVDDCAKVCLPFISHRKRSASLPSATADELTANTAPLVVSDAVAASLLRSNTSFAEGNIVSNEVRTSFFCATTPVGASEPPLCKGRWIAEQDGGIANPSQSTAFLRICFSDSVQGSAMGRYATERGFQKTAIIVDMSSDYSVGCAAAFRSSFSGEVVFEGRFLSGETDFSALVTELSKTDFDCVYFPAYYTEAGLFIRQAREQGITKTFLGGDAMDSPYLTDVIGKREYLHDIIYTDHFSQDDERYKEFARRFFDRYGEAPPAYSALAYDSVMLYCENIQSVENDIFNTESFQGVTGEITIKENGDCEKEPVFVSLLE